MVQVRTFTRYGFLPWDLIYTFEEMKAPQAPSNSPHSANSPLTPPFVPPAEQAMATAAQQSASAASTPAEETLTRVRFRRAVIAVDDPADFWSGITGGQVAALEESELLTGSRIFAMFEDAVRDVEFSETWLAGYLLGLSDALLRGRKLYPRAYLAHLRNLQAGKATHQER